MKTLIVDFNMIRADGLFPALLLAGANRRLAVGDHVTAADGEGTECQARVMKILKSGRLALLQPVADTWRRDSTFQPTSEQLLA